MTDKHKHTELLFLNEPSVCSRAGSQFAGKFVVAGVALLRHEGQPELFYLHVDKLYWCRCNGDGAQLFESSKAAQESIRSISDLLPKHPLFEKYRVMDNEALLVEVQGVF